MSRLILMSACLGILTGFSIHAQEQAASKPKPSDACPKKKQKWRSLFDGKTLKNWKETDFAGRGSVVVKNGEMIIESGDPLTGVTWAGKPLPKVNYEVTLEARRIEGSDFFCALTFPVKDSPCTLVLGGWGGGVIGLSSIDGFDASENETTDYYTFDPKKFYKIRLRVTDKKIQAWINKDQIADVDYTDKKIDIRIEVEQSRPFGIATFQTVGGIKNLKIRELQAHATEQNKPKDP